MSSTFFDAVVSTQFSDGVVRLGVADYIGPPADGQRPTGPTTYLTTTLPGLVQLQIQINQLVEGLVEKQVLRRQTPTLAVDDDKPIT